MATARRAPALSDHGLAGRRKRGTREGGGGGHTALGKTMRQPANYYGTTAV